MTHGGFVTDPAEALTDFDLSFGDSLNTPSYTISLQEQGNNVVVQASRGVGGNGGRYSGALLQAQVEPSGKITKRCVEGATAGLCEVVVPAEYTKGSSLIPAADEEETHELSPLGGCFPDSSGQIICPNSPRHDSCDWDELGNYVCNGR